MNNFYHGQSMRRVFRDGDVLLAEEIAGSSVIPGDVIIFKSPSGKMVVHRVICRSGTELITMGDNNPEPDRDPVDASGEQLLVRGFIRNGRKHRISRGAVGMRVFRINRLRRTVCLAGSRGLLLLKRVLPGVPLEICRKNSFNTVVHYRLGGITVARRFADGRVVFSHWYWRLIFALPVDTAEK